MHHSSNHHRAGFAILVAALLVGTGSSCMKPWLREQRQQAAQHAKACDDGDARACFNSANDSKAEIERALLEENREIESKLYFACDHHIAEACREVKNFGEGCRIGDAQSCLEESRRDVYYTSSEALAQRACALNPDQSQACTATAKALASGIGRPRDTAAANARLVARCLNREMDSCKALGELVTAGLLPTEVTP